jgi:TolB-like protein/predicted Zn-dependent protease
LRQQSFFVELQRRHVYKVGAAYVVAGWLLAQVVTQVLPVFGVSMLGQRVLVLMVIAGFPIALVLAWLFDVTPQGIVRTDALQAEGETPQDQREHRGADRKLNYVLGVLLLLAVGYVILDHALLRRADDAPVVDATSDKSIAVLPFANLSRDPDNAYFAEGIQDEILTRLTGLHELKVISRTSTQHFASSPDNLREIARQLGVANILEGSVQKAGDLVHVNVQLIRAATDEHLWAESYNRRLDDVFGVESEVAQTIAEKLKATLSGEETRVLAARPTKSAAAYAAYLRGISLADRSSGLHPNTLAAIVAFEEAVREDPAFADAWARLSSSHAFAYWQFDHSTAHREDAWNALARAQQLAPEALETRKADGIYRYWIERDYPAAQRLFERIREQAPSDGFVQNLLAAIARRQGRWDDSLQLWHEAIAVDPHASLSYLDAAAAASSSRQFALARELIDQGLNVVPEDSGMLEIKAETLQAQGAFEAAHKLLAVLPVAPGDDNLVQAIVDDARWRHEYPAAIALLRSQIAQPEALGPSLGVDQTLLADLLRLRGDAAGAQRAYTEAAMTLRAAIDKQPDDPNLAQAFAATEAGLGHRDEALAAARRAIALLPATRDAYVGPFFEETLARLQARFGERDAALAAIRHLLATNYGDPPLTPAILRVDPDFESLRGDPAFDELTVDPSPTARVPTL